MSAFLPTPDPLPFNRRLCGPQTYNAYLEAEKILYPYRESKYIQFVVQPQGVPTTLPWPLLLKFSH
jgi:hypothetical protein